MFGGGNTLGAGEAYSNGNSFRSEDGAWNTEAQLVNPDPFRRMP